MKNFYVPESIKIGFIIIFVIFCTFHPIFTKTAQAVILSIFFTIMILYWLRPRTILDEKKKNEERQRDERFAEIEEAIKQEDREIREEKIIERKARRKALIDDIRKKLQ